VPALTLALLLLTAVDGEPGPAGVHLGLAVGGGVVGDDAAAGVDVVTGVDTAPFSLFLRAPLTLRLVDHAPHVDPTAPSACRVVRCEEFLQGRTLDPTALARVVEELRLFRRGDPVHARAGRLLVTLGDGAVVDRFTTAASWDRRTSGAVLALRTPWHHAALDVVTADVLSPGELLAARVDVAPFSSGTSGDDDGALAPLRLSLDAGVDVAAPVDAVDRFGQVPAHATTRPLSSSALAVRYVVDGPVLSLAPRVAVGTTTGLSADGGRAGRNGPSVGGGVGGGIDVGLHTTSFDVRARVDGGYGTPGFRHAPFSTLYLVERRRALLGAVVDDTNADSGSSSDRAGGLGLLRVPAPGGAYFELRLEASMLDAVAPLLRVHTGPAPGENLVEAGVVVDEGPLRLGVTAQRRGMVRIADVVDADVDAFPITGALEASWQVWGPLSVGARWWRLPRFPGDGTLVIDDDVQVFVAVDGLLAFPGQR
jgi:hypothetical protein